MLRLLNFAAALIWMSAFSAAAPPNFVIILADDMGYGDASCYGGTAYETPHLDRLAAGGMRFTDFHSNGAVCSPTRAALLTGRYPQRSGIEGVVYADPRRNRHHGLHVGEITFPELLKKAGYATGCFGKWHLGYRKLFNPIHHGFDEFRGYVSGNVDFQNHIDGTGVFDWWHGDRLDREDQGYSTHLITKHAVSFIERHKDKPFCLYIPHEAPHYPYQGPNDPPLRREGVRGQRGGLWNDREPAHMKKAYAEMMIELDKGVAALKKHGLETNTLVFFFSDNGATGPGSNGMLRGRKGTLWEGGHRVPAVAWWPGKIEPGSTSDQTAMGMDLLPTMLDLAGVAPPPGHLFDGVSLRPVLFDGAALPKRDLFWKYGERKAMRMGPWKLVVGEKELGAEPDQRVALFNVADDPGETQNHAGVQLGITSHMLETLEKWEMAVEAGATPQPQRPAAE